MSDANLYERKALQPKELVRPAEPFSQVICARGSTTVYIAGQLGVDASGATVGQDIVTQTKQIFHNIEKALASCGGSWSNIVKFTTFLTHADDVALFCQTRRTLFAAYYPEGAYPANTMVVVQQLPKPEWRIEIEAIAVLP